jgi:hypothetical protein
MIERTTVGPHKGALKAFGGKLKSLYDSPRFDSGRQSRSRKFWSHKDSKSFKVWQQQRAQWERLYTPAQIDDGDWQEECGCFSCREDARLRKEAVASMKIQMFVDDSPELVSVVVNGKIYTRFGGV